MNEKIKRFLFKNGADLVGFADISNVMGLNGFNIGIVFGIGLSKEFVLATYNNLPTEKDEFLEKEHCVEQLADDLAEFIIQNGYKAVSQSEKVILEPVFNNGLPEFETAIFRHSRRGGEGIIELIMASRRNKEWRNNRFQRRVTAY